MVSKNTNGTRNALTETTRATIPIDQSMEQQVPEANALTPITIETLSPNEWREVIRETGQSLEYVEEIVVIKED